MKLLVDRSWESLRAASPVSRPDVLAARAFRLWRVLGTGLSFAVFGASALSLALLAFPLCHLVPGEAWVKEARVQRLIHHAYRFFIGFMEALGLIHTEWIGADRLSGPGPYLIVANHPTLIDVVHVISRLPQADCVIADGYARNPFVGLAAWWAGYITNARGAAVVDACVERLRAGRTVVFFPEGTRSPREGMHPFRRGAAHVALRAGVPLQPIVISCDPRMLGKGQVWWDVPESPGRYTLRVVEPIDLHEASAAGGSDALAARKLTDGLRACIEERLNRAGLR